MDLRLMDYLACPQCSGELTLEGAPEEGSRVRSGILHCKDCNKGYAINNGIPRLNEALEEFELVNVRRTFGYEWKAHHKGEFESDTLFGRTREQDWELISTGMRISDDDVEGAVVLDAGCGSGRFCQLFAEHGASLVVGIDMNDAVDAAAAYCEPYENVQIVQANIFKLPFKRKAFDLVWSQGVIHHTPDASGAAHALAQVVKPGGILWIWVYAKRFNPFRFVKTIFDRTRISSLPPGVLKVMAKVMAVVSMPLLWGYQAARKLPGLRSDSERVAWTARRRTVEELELTWFDAISPQFDTRHTEDEVIGWFRREGFEAIAAVEEPKVGVRGVAPLERELAAAPERSAAA